MNFLILKRDFPKNAAGASFWHNCTTLHVLHFINAKYLPSAVGAHQRCHSFIFSNYAPLIYLYAPQHEILLEGQKQDLL